MRFVLAAFAVSLLAAVPAQADCGPNASRALNDLRTARIEFAKLARTAADRRDLQRNVTGPLDRVIRHVEGVCRRSRGGQNTQGTRPAPRPKQK